MSQPSTSVFGRRTGKRFLTKITAAEFLCRAKFYFAGASFFAWSSPVLFSKALAQVTTGVYRVLAQTRVNKARLPSTPCHEQAICSANVVINGYSDRGRRKASGNPTV